MKRLFVPKETDPFETRAALAPDDIPKLLELGFEIEVESGLGLAADFSDADYEKAGARITDDRAGALKRADSLCRVRASSQEEIALLPKGVLQISFLDPFHEGPMLNALAAAEIDAISLELIPRTTLAQKMDALSSQANLAGYAAVLLAASRLRKLLPMLMTAAGTISPARFLIVGVGVAGLQAIATARRLGARVDAFDTRPVVEEQVRSLGAKFIKIDLGETGQTSGGYAKELSAEQLERQRAELAKACARADVVITTAKVFGKPAPRIITAAMLEKMTRGSLVIDLAIESGGNVEGAKPNEEVTTEQGVRILGPINLEGRHARDATRMLSANFTNLITHCYDKEKGAFRLDDPDEILQGCLLTRGGRKVHPNFQD